MLFGNLWSTQEKLTGLSNSLSADVNGPLVYQIFTTVLEGHLLGCDKQTSFFCDPFKSFKFQTFRFVTMLYSRCYCPVVFVQTRLQLEHTVNLFWAIPKCATKSVFLSKGEQDSKRWSVNISAFSLYSEINVRRPRNEWPHKKGSTV